MGVFLPYFNAIAFFFVYTITEEGFGELVVVRDPGKHNGSMTKLTCFSEDDNSALIWNHDANSNYGENTRFQPEKRTSRNASGCAIWNPMGCFVEWKDKSAWNRVNSSLEAMGPVLDYRWEGFSEIIYDIRKNKMDYQYVGKVKEASGTGTVVFSARGFRNINIFLCQNINPTNGPCLWVLLGAGKETSALRDCTKGPPIQDSVKDDCKSINNGQNQVQNIIHPYEWRTFAIKWTTDKKTIEIFKQTDPKNGTFLHGRYTKWNNGFHISITGGGAEARCRFHFYEYWRTEIKNSVLQTKTFYQQDKNFCVKLLVGLCHKCQLNVSLVENQDQAYEIGSISGGKKSVYNGLLTWQSVILKMDDENLRSKNLSLSIQTILDTKGVKGQWAIDHFQTCESPGRIREATIEVHRDLLTGSRVASQIHCQKLSYNKSQNAVVNSLSPIDNDDDISRSQRFLQEWVKSCGTRCTNFGKGWSFCNSFGCMCSKGFMGKKCDEQELCLKVEPIAATCLQVIDCRAVKPDSSLIEVYNSTFSQLINLPASLNITNLEAYTKYELRLVGTGNMLWSTKVRTLQSAPGEVRNLQYTTITDKEVHLNWSAPLKRNGIIIGYTVRIQLKKLIGCSDLKRPTPPTEDVVQFVESTTASIDQLHPYAEYSAVVIANTIEPGPGMSINFTTKPARLPTSVVSNLTVVDNQLLKWGPPEDCTTISGPIGGTRLLFAGIDDWARKWKAENFTEDNLFNLTSLTTTPYTKYRVITHTVRAISKADNPQLREETDWTTLPSVPPKVTNLTVFDADSKENNISLRWKPPDPPYGEIESYHVRIGEGYRIFVNRSINATEGICDLWKDYVCFENVTLSLNDTTNLEGSVWEGKVLIHVKAKNKNVTGFGASEEYVFSSPLDFSDPPSDPEELEFNYTGHGIVELKWKYPRSPTKINQFQISIETEKTDLQEMPKIELPSPVIFTEQCKNYMEKLHLAPSTRYKISIISTSGKLSSHGKNETISVPAAFGFKDHEELQVTTTGTLINVKIPEIINATQNSIVNVTVSGNLTCTKNNSQINETVLIIDTYYITKSGPTSLKIGTDQKNIRKLNCSLYLGESYTIKVTVENEIGSFLGTVETYQITLENNYWPIIWSIILAILMICSLVVFLWRKKVIKACSKRRNNKFADPQNVRSTENLIAIFARRRSRLASNARDNRASSAIYAVPSDLDSRVVTTDYFSEYVQKGIASGLLLSQFMMFQRDLTKPCHYGKLPQNMAKNRDKNLIAYDDTRVVLQKLPDNPYSDYINANYIQGHRGEKTYIATQGPLPDTVNDFWRMVWQEKVYVICMLTNLIENEQVKCEQYWPEVGIKVKYGDVSVLNTGHRVFADYTIRYFRLGCQKYKRKITQLHYTGWPDHEVPTYFQSLVAYFKVLEKTPTGNGPTVVHCSTGEGRTGTLILCDICLRQGDESKTIDALAATNQLRESRANMVGTPQQYVLAHIVITEGINTTQTQLPCTDDLPARIKKLRRQLPSDVQRLKDTEWQERALYALVTPKCPTPGDFTRKRLPELDSICPDVIYFARYSGDKTDKSHYIGAVSVDGAKAKKQYLASQLPSSSTWSKFWLLIAQKNIELVIILQSPDPEDSNCCNILPNNRNFAPVPYITVESKRTFCEDQFTIEELLLTDTSGDEERAQSVAVIRCTGWEQGPNGKPPAPSILVSVWRASEKVSRKEGPTLVFCHDGVTGCGLYLALSFLLERMTIDRECDVISAVRAVRRFRPEFVQPMEQFEYLYDAAVSYMECFQTYSNFT